MNTSYRKNTIYIEKYRLIAIILSEKFQKILLPQLHRKLLAQNLDFPNKGHKTIADYLNWKEKLLSHNINVNTLLEEILEQFNLDIEGCSYIFPFSQMVFFNSNDILKPSPISFISADSKNKESVTIRIQIWNTTREDDWKREWKRTVVPLLKHKPNFPNKDREWENFECYFKVYELMQKLKSTSDKDPKKVSLYKQTVESDEFEKIKHKYLKNNLDDSLRTIVSRCRKVFENMNFV